jgi:uroporphyrinogen-III decarboxylase
MDRRYYLDLAASGLRMPIGPDLILHEKPDPIGSALDGQKLGAVLVEAAERFKTPLAVALMNLKLEKAALLRTLDVSESALDTFHFKECPTEAMRGQIERRLADPPAPDLRAHVESVAFVARQKNLIPVGMAIGPFSLMTKLLVDPISAVYMAGTGLRAEDDDEVRLMETVLDLALKTTLRSIQAQIAAGAKVICIAEPAANKAYISPKQLAEGSDVFERCVSRPNRQIRALLAETGTDLFFHCCGELTDYFVKKFAEFDPAILSLGSSRALWDDSALVPKTTVLFGNLPTKHFHSDEAITKDQVAAKTKELIRRMKPTGHPFIVGSECDVLSVQGKEQTIQEKVAVMLNCPTD